MTYATETVIVRKLYLFVCNDTTPRSETVVDVTKWKLSVVRLLSSCKNVLYNFFIFSFFSQDNILLDVYCLLALMVGFRIISFLFLLRRSYKEQ